jgi:hypothetical protein
VFATGCLVGSLPLARHEKSAVCFMIPHSVMYRVAKKTEVYKTLGKTLGLVTCVCACTYSVFGGTV